MRKVTIYTVDYHDRISGIRYPWWTANTAFGQRIFNSKKDALKAIENIPAPLVVVEHKIELPN